MLFLFFQFTKHFLTLKNTRNLFFFFILIIESLKQKTEIDFFDKSIRDFIKRN